METKKGLTVIGALGALIALLFTSNNTSAQCINVFPHVEDFETAPTWTAVTAPTSSLAATSDWTWGAPNHTYVIKSAGSGNKCWNVGGLTGAFYNFWEQSYIISPCYNFTNLLYPHIKFKLFYDSEYRFDGGNLQSSINGGVTWQDVGTVGGTNAAPIPEPNDCNTQNWYNYPGITYLNNPVGFVTSKHGWCGNTQAGGVGWDPSSPATNCIGGFGLGKWVTAEHCLTGLAGKPNVLFRFTFGAGFTCNNFDGFSIDSVAVSNGILNAATFTRTCAGVNTLNFTATPKACPTNTYAWNFGDPASGASNTAIVQNPSHTFSGPGSYTVSLIVSGGACNPPDTIKQVVNVMTASVTSFTNVSCNGGNNGAATAIVNSGIAPLTYTWSPLGGNAATATGMTAGNYTVAVNGTNSCPVTATVTITQPPTLSVTPTQTNVACFGGTTGTASVAVSGGTPGYTYSWTPSGGTGGTASGLSAGNYSVTVTDLNNCKIIQSITITQPTALVVSVTTTSTSCIGNNGTATATVTGGTGAYTYTWSPTGGNSSSASGLAGGTYTVAVTDANSCNITATCTVIQPVSFSVTAASTPVSCNGGSNGTASATVTGGSGPYTYSWSPLGGTTNNASNLSAGNYTVAVKDASGCSYSASVIITQPALLSASVTSTNITCNGLSNGSSTVTATGGTGAYTYSWLPSGGTNSTATNLSQGNYTATVTDAKGCTATASVLVSQPAIISLTINSTPVTCNGLSNGTSSVSATGGTGAYTYTWSPIGGNTNNASGLPFGNYTVTVKDANGCTATATITVTQPTAITVTLTSTNASCSTNNGTATANASGGTGALTYTWMPLGGSTTTATGLGAGTYTVKVTDANGCSVTSSTTITQPATFTLSVSSTSVTCNGGSNGSLTANIIGGTAPFSYQWSPIGGTNAATGNILTAGTYTVNVTDAGLCSATSTITLSQPSPVTVSANGQTVCKGQAATLTASAAGGNGAPYIYTWNTGATGQSISVNTTVNTTYTVVATDNKGCVSLPDTAMVNVLAPLSIIVVSNDTICAGKQATLSATPGGGNGNYTITWLPSNTTGNSITVYPTITTTYTAIVNDGCTITPASASGQVTVLQNPIISFNPNPASGCAPICVTFAAVASTVSGNNIVSYTWNFGDGGTASGLNTSHCYANSGAFSVYLLGITQKGCRDSLLKSNLITVFPRPNANFNASAFETDIYSPTINFYDLSQSNITNWQWNFQQGANSIVQNPIYTYSTEGTYPVVLIVTNVNGCKDTIVKIITIKPVFTFYAPNAFTPNIDGINEKFLPVGTAWDLNTYNLWVFDRWGNKLFHTNDAYQGWDGTKHGEVLMQDVYVWKVELNDSFGGHHEYNGVVSIVK